MGRWGVHHDMSILHLPCSNSHTKATIQAMKSWVAMMTHNSKLNDDDFCTGLLEWCNTPRDMGCSPAPVLFGHPTCIMVSGHRRMFAAEWQPAVDKCDV